MRVAMLGLGLIGGSVARAAVTAGMDVRAWTPSGTGPRVAAADGVVAASSVDDAVDGADLVVLAAPPLACLDLILTLAATSGSALDPGAVVTDVASTKGALVERARQVRLRFVGGHPMAGLETTGYGAADQDLFRDRPWVIVPPEPPDEEAVARVQALVSACGARPVRMTATEHDVATALISHAPLVISAALIAAAAERPEWETARGIAAGGWASMTRLAKGDPVMGAGTLATNRVATANALRAYAGAIEAWLELLERGADPAELADRLTAARAAATDG